MDHYLELKLLADPEFPQPMLMNALLAKLHRALHDLRRDDIGVSFPEVSQQPRSLGGCLRLHSSREALVNLQALNWLSGMYDHLRILGPEPVPSTARYRQVSRVQVDSNPERLRRRLIKRHGISEEEARQRIPDSRGNDVTCLSHSYVAKVAGRYSDCSSDMDHCSMKHKLGALVGMD